MIPDKRRNNCWCILPMTPARVQKMTAVHMFEAGWPQLCLVHIHGFILRFLTDRQIRKSTRILHDLVTFTITLGVATIYNGINTIY